MRKNSYVDFLIEVAVLNLPEKEGVTTLASLMHQSKTFADVFTTKEK